MAESVNQMTQWIVNGLWGGYTAANVLKWHWYRLNGFGYFWGMLAGHRLGALHPAVLPELGARLPGRLPDHPRHLAAGCVLGSLLTDPEEDEILKSFYKQVRPWGFWGPVYAKVIKEDPSFKRNTNFFRDMFNCGVAIIWQIPMWVIPIYVVFRSWKALWISIGVLLVTSVILKFNWYDKLEDDHAGLGPGKRRRKRMRYGQFDDERREYVISRPDTPLPWINYLGCEAYFGIISNTAGGYSFYRDARLRRLTRYRYNNAPFDFGGRYIYLRDRASGEYWSPTWQPTRRAVDRYTCRHGMGYTIIGSTFAGIRAETLYFVPLGENLEIWQLSLTNQREEPVSLSAFSSVEFCLWDAQDDSTNFQRNFSTGQVEIEQGVIYHKTEYRERRNHFAYFACSEKPAGFDTQRDVFLGPYRGWEAPAAVERGCSFNSVAHGWAPIGSHQVDLTLHPKETRQVIFLLGYHENPPEEKFDPPESQTINKRTVRPVIEKYLAKANADAAFSELREHWNRLLGVLQVQTPSTDTNRMVNIWNAYQCMVTFNMSRSASFYESGIGRGMGFRDSNQDLLGFVHMIPERAKERILDLAATQLASGGAFHQYQTLTKRGNNDIGSGFNDDPLWLILGTAAYIKESGDWSILDAMVPYENEPGTETPLYEHLQRCISYTLERLGPHGLPLDRPRRLERLSQPELLLRHARAVIPDHHEQGRQSRRVGLHRRTLRHGCQGTGGRCAQTRPGAGRALLCLGCREDGDNGPGARMGRRVVPSRLR